VSAWLAHCRDGRERADNLEIEVLRNFLVFVEFVEFVEFLVIICSRLTNLSMITMSNLFARKSALLILAAVTLTPLVAHAQFGNLMQQLQKLQPPTQQGQGGMPSFGAGKAPAKGGSDTSAKWCSYQELGSLGRMKIDTGVISSEFKVPELEALQDDFIIALRKDKISKTFPSAKFFQASFETKRVRAIYDTFLAFPEPETLAALIQISRAPDQQERTDALMALTFLHMQAPELSISNNRWSQTYQSALSGGEHFTALVFRARMAAYGEYGAKNLAQAVGDLVTAGSLPGKYSQGEGTRKEFDTQNVLLIHTNTAKEIFLNEPNMPYRQQWEGPAKQGMQVEKAQLEFARQMPSTKMGKMFAQASQINAESVQIGNEIIKSTQGGNQLMGQLASLESLRSKNTGDKQVFEVISPEIHAAQIKMIAKAGTLDERQKQMLVQAQEKRLAAQGIYFQTYGLFTQMLMASGSDILKIMAVQPALSEANNALIQSCVISGKWDQAMRAKDVAKVDMKKVETNVGQELGKYKD
jgi:hypothetical protein